MFKFDSAFAGLAWAADYAYNQEQEDEERLAKFYQAVCGTSYQLQMACGKLTYTYTLDSGEVVKVPVELSDVDTVVKVLERVRQDKEVDLKGAQIIVAGGYGVGSKENFKLIRELAEALGGEVGASRAAVDAGWISHDYQIGQTGVTVRPRLYICAGISGSIQHRAGMTESKKIIAINTDPNAPIFSCAHYAIVGDLNQVIPQMIKAFKAKA